MQASEPDARALADALARVYQRPEFRDEPNRLLQLVSDLWSALVGWIVELLAGVLGPLSTDSPIVRAAVLAALGVLIVLAVRHLVRALAGASLVGTNARPRARADGADSPRSLAEWEALAREAAAAGRLREAARALHHVLLLRLERAGAVRFHEGKTPGDYRRELAPQPSLAAAYDRFLQYFFPVAFGPGTPDPDTFARLGALAVEAVPEGTDA